MTIQQIEGQFRSALKSKGIVADVTITKFGVNICTLSEVYANAAKQVMSKVDSVTYDDTDFYGADDDMPAEWYVRYTFN